MMAETRTRQSLHKQYKKKKKETDWKGKSYPYMQKGETTKEHHNKVKAWLAANPDKEIPDFGVLKLGLDVESVDSRRLQNKGGSIKKGDSNYYAHGGSVRKTKLSDY